MFTADDIQARLHQQPFGALRFVISTGQTYDVRHPELVLVGRNFLVIGLPSVENPSQAEQVTRVSLLHVTELQGLPAPNSATGDGAS